MLDLSSELDDIVHNRDKNISFQPNYIYIKLLVEYYLKKT